MAKEGFLDRPGILGGPFTQGISELRRLDDSRGTQFVEHAPALRGQL